MTTCPDPNKNGNPSMSAPLSPDAMNYLAKVRGVLDRRPDVLPSVLAIPATQAVVDEIKAADPDEIAEIFGVDHFAAHFFTAQIGNHTLGVPDPERGHEALSPDTMNYLAEVRKKLDEIDEDRAIPSLPIVPAPHEAVVDEVKAADPAVLAEILFLSVNLVRAFAERVSTTPLPTPEEQEERLQRMHDAIEFHEMGINPWRFDYMWRVMWRLERRAMVHVADDYSCGDDRLEVGCITDPPLAEQVADLTLDQLRGLCIDYARVTAHSRVQQYCVDHDDDEAVFLAVSDYRDGPARSPNPSARGTTCKPTRLRRHRRRSAATPKTTCPCG
jgi:hypothetical protein